MLRKCLAGGLLVVICLVLLAVKGTSLAPPMASPRPHPSQPPTATIFYPEPFIPGSKAPPATPSAPQAEKRKWEELSSDPKRLRVLLSRLEQIKKQREALDQEEKDAIGMIHTYIARQREAMNDAERQVGKFEQVSRSSRRNEKSTEEKPK